MKRPSLKIKGIEKGEETQVKDTESVCNKSIEEHFPNLKEEMPIKGQESYRTSDRLDQKRKSSWYIIKAQHIEQRKSIKSCKRKGPTNIKRKENPIRITSDSIQKLRP